MTRLRRLAAWNDLASPSSSSQIEALDWLIVDQSEALIQTLTFPVLTDLRIFAEWNNGCLVLLYIQLEIMYMYFLYTFWSFI